MAWKKGPLPEGKNTWYWGAVISRDMGSNSGFQFASFEGDHVRTVPGNEVIDGKDVAYYDNSLVWPIPKEVKES